MNILRRGIMAAVIVMAAVIAPVTQAAAAPAAPGSQLVAWDDQTGAGLQAWECSEFHICFWTGRNGTGSRCIWDIADPDWTSGGVVCSWAKTKNVASVMNLGTSSDGSTGVAYYTQTNYNSRIGCTRNQHGGNLAGTYQLRSHKWISGSCG
ncbi:MAG TPA: peptidase inhibitor family I36 protein [Actinophytocola sp.]|uniref:peptidase inhibitor family I36 protein n=1 Tax=Actinophytocola sp. TaxID=1872138 RepID=UPI002DBE2EA3|nr:peptidase inhibitor family I36 protein [Actinophytocola sp.]HEU5470696.1 peptidase inhibitor family I36 protein [Actinophytocola sp.]